MRHARRSRPTQSSQRIRQCLRGTIRSAMTWWTSILAPIGVNLGWTATNLWRLLARITAGALLMVWLRLHCVWRGSITVWANCMVPSHARCGSSCGPALILKRYLSTRSRTEYILLPGLHQRWTLSLNATWARIGETMWTKRIYGSAL